MCAGGSDTAALDTLGSTAAQRTDAPADPEAACRWAGGAAARNTAAAELCGARSQVLLGDLTSPCQMSRRRAVAADGGCIGASDAMRARLSLGAVRFELQTVSAALSTRPAACG